MLKSSCRTFIRYTTFDIEGMITAILALEQAYDDAEIRIVVDHHTSMVAAIACTDAYLSS